MNNLNSNFISLFSPWSVWAPMLAGLIYFFIKSIKIYLYLNIKFTIYKINLFNLIKF